MKTQRVAGVFLVSFLLLLTSHVLADGSQLLHGHVPRITAQLRPLGEYPATNHLKLAISLPLRNQAALSNLLAQIYDPHSANYRHYLTPEQFTENFGPSGQDYRALIAFANANGLRVTRIYSNRLLVDVDGSVENIQRALHTSLNVYRHPTENRTFYAPAREPSLDLSVPILHISGLDNYELPRPRLVANRIVSGQNTLPNAGSGPGGAYRGRDFRAAYVPDSTLNGSGQSVGLLEFDGYSAGDINYYETAAGLPNIPLQNVLIDGASGAPDDPGGADVEVALDIETAISLGTNLSQVVVYIAPNGQPFEDILNQMVLNTQVKQFSCSWYIENGGSQPAADQIWEQMAAQGQSFFNASGDYDAYTGLISFPGDSPYITQVGGTTLTTSGPGGAWVSESVWNRGNGVGSGGGISTQYPIPFWQTNISMAANQGSTTMRNTPDVAMTAENVYVRVDDSDYSVGGTSCAAPLWAGFASLVNQQAAASGKPSIGFINPDLDDIGTSPAYGNAFHDIITGNNTSPNSPKAFYATAGYDLCTGWGTPAGQALINALANPEPLIITPNTGFASAGGVGGPFTITSQELSLTNAGTNTLTWTLSNTSEWLTVSSVGGTLAPGGPATTVTVSLNAAAANLAAGSYSATLWITNLNDDVRQGVSYLLRVIAPPAITTQPASQAVLEGTTATFSVAATGGTPLSYQWQLNGTNLIDGGNISGSQTTNLIVSDVSGADIGNYSVTVTNPAGTAVSGNASLTITPSAPVIIMQPSNQTAVVGQTVEFSVHAVGNTPFFYQWNFNGAGIIGATNSIYILEEAQLTNSGTFTVEITNTLGSVLSSNAALTVVPTPPCDPPPSGIVAWWPGEGNANDVIGTNNGTLEGGAGYAPGEVGQAFSFDGSSGYVFVPASPSLNVATNAGFTVEGWIDPYDWNQRIIVEWDNGSIYGVHMQSSTGNGGVQSNGALFANIRDVNQGDHYVYTAPGLLVTNQFQHVALTYDHTTGIGTLYLNGVIVGQQNVGIFSPQTSYDFYIGHRPNTTWSYWLGLEDEISVYNRVLSSNEIAAIYNAGSGGKCPPVPGPPVIVLQPTNETVAVGQSAGFTVEASGPAPLSYQWLFNGTNLPGATSATLTLTNIQMSQAGTYAVTVTNLFGSTLSSNAELNVYGIPPAITAAPDNQSVLAGETANFSVTAQGTPPLSYQWSFNGTNLAGATNTVLVLDDVQISQAGTYTVTVTNLYGSTNAGAALTVIPIGSCHPAPSGIVAWWPGNGNANDVIGTNNGTLEGSAGYAPGKVGQAFSFDGSSGYVLVPASPSLNVATNAGFTVEGWIDPYDWNQRIILEWDNGSIYGVHMQSSTGNGGVQSNGALFANIRDVNQGNHYVYTAPGLLVTNQFQHVALTYNHTTGIGTLYLNGVVVGQQAVGIFTPQTSYDFYIGHRPNATWSYWLGLEDEISVYNRVLSSNEIAAIYNAGSEGKCPPGAPVIIQGPTNQTVIAGGKATFNVSVEGSSPLNYQWYWNETPLAGATNATFVLTNVQTTNAGTYSIIVTNAYGSSPNPGATLAVIPLDHFAWTAIFPTTFVNVPFSVEITAQDISNNVVTNYTGVVFISSTNGVPVSPTVSGNFVQGVWTGAVTVSQMATNLVLSASDGAGHIGLANPISVAYLPLLTLLSSSGTEYISWSTTASGFVLETTTNLVSGNWVPVTTHPLQFGNQYVQPITPTATNAFYRLELSNP